MEVQYAMWGLVLLALITIIILQIQQRAGKSNSVEAARALEGLQQDVARLEQRLREEMRLNREEHARNERATREELQKAFGRMAGAVNEVQTERFSHFSKRLEDTARQTLEQLENMRQTVERRLFAIQEDNNTKLEKMRETVDEKLHKTLEERLGQSFRLVSDRLELVHKGLGEMQSLATGVGDLKRVLTNVKSRGVMGEYQLGSLLEHMLAPGQYMANVKPDPASDSIVEFGIQLPGNGQDDKPIWLPVDAKFPVEDYQALMAAQENGDAAAAILAGRQLEARIKQCARDIHEKYICPPHTTDFALMFLPFEGLYAEVLRRPGLFEQVQREYRVTISGPTTLSALLSSLQMGFRTLAIQKRSSEVWETLGAVKGEFSKFGLILARTRKKLQEVQNTIESAERRTRVMERTLKDVDAPETSETSAAIAQTAENIALRQGDED